MSQAPQGSGASRPNLSQLLRIYSWQSLVLLSSLQELLVNTQWSANIEFSAEISTSILNVDSGCKL